MKINGNGQAKVLTKTEIELLFTEGFSLNRDRCLFAMSDYNITTSTGLTDDILPLPNNLVVSS